MAKATKGVVEGSEVTDKARTGSVSFFSFLFVLPFVACGLYRPWRCANCSVPVRCPTPTSISPQVARCKLPFALRPDLSRKYQLEHTEEVAGKMTKERQGKLPPPLPRTLPALSFILLLEFPLRCLALGVFLSRLRAQPPIDKWWRGSPRSPGCIVFRRRGPGS